MDNRNLQEKVRAVMTRVLEDAAFIFSNEPAPGSGGDFAGWKATGAAITFSGERSGVFRLWTDPALCSVLASNMLGIDPGLESDTEKKGIDALRETVNIIAGNLLTELFGTEAVLELGLPEPANLLLKEADCLRSDAVWLNAEGNRILGVVEVHE